MFCNQFLLITQVVAVSEEKSALSNRIALGIQTTPHARPHAQQWMAYMKQTQWHFCRFSFYLILIGFFFSYLSLACILLFSVLCFCGFCVCVCVLFFLLLFFSSFLFILYVCFLKQENRSIELDGWGGGKNLEGVGRGIMIRMYCMKK